MDSYEIKAEFREKTGKNATKKLRKEGKIPCVLYGKDETVHFTAETNIFHPIVFTPYVYLIDLKIGDKNYHAMLQEIQFHPVTDEIQHLDFLKVYEGVPVDIRLPIRLNGVPRGVTQGGKLMQFKRKLLANGLPKDLPNELNIDISKLGLDTAIRVRDLKYENLELIDPENQIIVAVKSAKALAAVPVEEEEEEEEGEEAEEGEEGEEGASGEEESSEE